MTTNNGPYKGEGVTVDVFDGSVALTSEPAAEEPKYRNKKWLYYQYHEEQKSQKDIADEYGYSESTISRWVGAHDIPVRDRSEAVSLAKHTDDPYKDRDWLHTQYVVLEQPMGDIAKSQGVCKSTIYRWLLKHEIDIRNVGEAIGLQNEKDGPWKSESWLRDQYVEQGKPTTQIAEECDVSVQLINEWVHQHDIPVRDNGALAPATKTDRKYADRGWLSKQYEQRNRPIARIADECDVTTQTIHYWLDEYGMDTPSQQETALRLSWENNAIPRKQVGVDSHSEGDVDEIARGNRSYSGPREGLNVSWSDFKDRSVGGKWVPYQNEEWLREQYLDDEKSGKELAEMCGVSRATIYRWLDRFGIERRDIAEVQASHVRCDPDKTYRNCDWLYEQYCDNGKTTTEIAELCGVADSTISTWLNKHDIDGRDAGDYATLDVGVDPDETYRDREWLYDQYWGNEKATDEIASDCDVTPGTIRQWMIKHDIDRRSISDAKVLAYRRKD